MERAAAMDVLHAVPAAKVHAVEAAKIKINLLDKCCEII